MNDTPTNLLPKSYYYHFYALFLVMLSAWVLLAVITLLFGLVTYFSTHSLPLPRAVEVAVMLVITLIAAVKLKSFAVVTLTEEGLEQAGTLIPYHTISHIEDITKWYIRIIFIHGNTAEKKSIILLSPAMIKESQELLLSISTYSGQAIKL